MDWINLLFKEDFKRRTVCNTKFLPAIYMVIGQSIDSCDYAFLYL